MILFQRPWRAPQDMGYVGCNTPFFLYSGHLIILRHEESGETLISMKFQRKEP